MGQTLFDASLTEADRQPRIYAYYFKQWNGFDMPFHTHAGTEIMYAISGSSTVEVMGEAGRPKRYPLTKGEFVVLNATVAHKLIVEDECRMLNVEFDYVPSQPPYPSIRGLCEAEPALAPLLAAPRHCLALADHGDVHLTLKHLVLELDEHREASSALVPPLMQQLLIRIARLRREAEEAGHPATGPYVRDCIRFLRQNYDRPIKVEDAAAAVSLHPGYLQRIFKAQTGATFVEYLTALRMDKAKMLLRRTDVPVTEVYDYVGVGSRQYFHALFKKTTGMTPLEYRGSAQRIDRPYRDSEPTSENF